MLTSTSRRAWLSNGAGEPWQVGERGARALRSELGLGDAPIDIRDVIRRRGVLLAIQRFPTEWGDGRYLKKGIRNLIILNATIGDSNRARFTAAHELGHHELHRDQQEVVVYIDTNVHAPARTKNREEREADAFAAYLLAPTDALLRELHGVPGRDVTPDHIVGLMRRYGLSYTSLAYRVHNAGLISATTRNRLLELGEGHVRQLLSAFPPRDDDAFFSSPQLPDDFRASALALYEHRHVTLERLAELLRITQDEALALVREAGNEHPASLEPDEDAVAELRALAEGDIA